MFLFTPIPAVQRALDGSMAQQNVIAQNIANVDTPNYKAKQVVFDDVLNASLEAHRTNPRHLPFSTQSDNGYRIIEDDSGVIQNNGNNVDIDQEMSDLARNQLYYQTLTQSVSNQFQRFNTVLGGSI